MGDFRKNILSYKLISRGKNYCKETPGEKISYTEKKKLHLCMSEKNLSPEVWENKPKPNHPYPPHKSNNQLLIQPSVLAPRQCGRLARRNVWRRGARKDGCISRLEFIPAALSANGSYCTLKHCLCFLTEIKVTTSILVAV